MIETIVEITILLLLVLTPAFILLLVSIVWYFWSKDKVKTEIIRNKEIIFKKKLNRLIWKQEAPFGEIRYPVMMITISSFVFVILTLGFGASINTQTGQPVWEVDWDQYFDDEGRYDPWVVSPMDQFMINNRSTIFAMIWFGYCGMVCILCVGWFEYMKWRWEHIPIEIKYRTVVKIEKDYLRKNKLRTRS